MEEWKRALDQESSRTFTQLSVRICRGTVKLAIKSVKYLKPQSPEVHELVFSKYKNPKKRATYIRQSFAIVVMGAPDARKKKFKRGATQRDQKLEAAMKSLSISSLTEAIDPPKSNEKGLPQKEKLQARIPRPRKNPSPKPEPPDHDTKKEEYNLGVAMGWGYKSQ